MSWKELDLIQVFVLADCRITSYSTTLQEEDSNTIELLRRHIKNQ